MLPGFTIPSSLGKARYVYATVSQMTGGSVRGASVGDGAFVSASLPSFARRFAPLAGGRICGPCYIDDTGACVKDCTDGTTAACLPSLCCPAGRDPCPGPDPQHPARTFCCPAGQECCNSETHTCCDPSAGEMCCGDLTCRNVRSDPQNCGDCGHACPQPPNSTATCTNLTCGFVCNAGYQQCGNACVDKNNDPLNCGMCGHACPAPLNSTATCSNGTCGFVCNPGYQQCGNTCVNTNTDVLNCGRCGHACPPRANSTPTCSSGICGYTCNVGSIPCGNACLVCQPPANSTAMCINGACGFKCNAGSKQCGNACVTCPQGGICIGSICGCPAGYKNCGGTCAPCPVGGNTCFGSSCICPVGLTNCGGTCITCPAPGICSGTTCVFPFQFAVRCEGEPCQEITVYATDESTAEDIVKNNYGGCDITDGAGVCP